MLFVACCLLLVVCGSWFVVWCLIECLLLFGFVCCELFVDCFVVCCVLLFAPRLSVVVVSCLLFAVVCCS